MDTLLEIIKTLTEMIEIKIASAKKLKEISDYSDTKQYIDGYVTALYEVIKLLNPKV